eukprot:3941452-Rhodomonas_salina.3
MCGSETTYLCTILEQLAMMQAKQAHHSIRRQLGMYLHVQECRVLHHKTKHIDVLARYHLCNLVRTNIMTLLKIGTHDMVADTLTKALPQPAFVAHQLEWVVLE